MNRDEFLQFLIETYDDFTEINTKPRLRAYKHILDENINYDELYTYTLKHHESLKFAPSPAFLYNATFKMKEEVYNPYM